MRTLLLRVVELQRKLAQKEEKEEFQAEHTQQLLDELKKKNRVIEHFVGEKVPGDSTSNRAEGLKVRAGKQIFFYKM